MINPILSLILFLHSVRVYSHGYVSQPIARQEHCLRKRDFNSGAANIQDEGCRRAYEHVEQRNFDPTYQFIQSNEIAAMAGETYTDINHIKQNVVPTNLCGANADGSGNFGDKSGLSVIANWTYTILREKTVQIEFCASATHNPSYWEIYMSKDGYNPSQKTLEWDDLELHAQFSDIQPINKGQFSICQSDYTYNMTVTNLPDRQQQFVIFVRWQRNDLAGEGFYNCVDVKYE